MKTNGVLFLTLILGVILALPISIWLIRRYGLALKRSMQTQTPLAAPIVPLPSVANPPIQSPGIVPTFPEVDRDPSGPTTPVVAALYDQLLRDPWRVAVIYGIGGVCFAAIMALSWGAAAETFGPLLVLALYWACVWPIVLTTNLIACTNGSQKFKTVLIYSLVFIFIEAILVVSGSAAWALPLLWLLLGLLPTLVLLAFLNRRVRAVGPLVLTFLVLALAGPQLVVAIASDESLRLLVAIGQAFGLGGRAIFIGLVLFGLAAAGPIGWLMLKWIRSRYEAKKISDESIIVDSIWLSFGLVQALFLSPAGDRWMLSGIVAFIAYKTVTLIGLRIIRDSRSQPENRKLLLLRRFSLGPLSEELFDALAKHWRYAGSIQLIAGPDLAKENLEPHEFLDFLSRKLARRFIDAQADLDERVSQLDPEPDHDGRFRVNEFFCHDDTWKPVLSRLVQNTVVLMDLRGFSENDKGCAYEIAELLNSVPLARVRFIVDDTADTALMATLRTSWNTMTLDSPNRANAKLRLFQFRKSGTRELPELLHSLCEAADAA